MEYQPITCVWEVTMGCNMRCGHCGSSCLEPLPDELSTEEALKVCDQLSEIGLKWITLSGGEPLTRKDTPLLIERLTKKGVSVNIITNGWLLEEKMAESLKQSGISTVAISIDGTEKIHDKIRRKGAFAHARDAFATLKRLGVNTGAVTTITKQNIGILGELKESLIEMGVKTWQVQIGLPMGNLKERPDWLIEPAQVKDIIDFCYSVAKEGRIKIYPADCIGYFTKQEQEIKKISFGTEYISPWDGCNAGIRGFGILQNGDILGCTSIRDKKFIEGNLKERTLRDIWEDKKAFLWRRGLKKEMLGGDCKICRYGEKCLGGCTNTRLTMNSDIYSENQYCCYNLLLKKMMEDKDNTTGEEDTKQKAQCLMHYNEYQEAAFVLKKLAKAEPEDGEVWKMKAYCEYKCGNYQLCKEDNLKALEIEPEDSYACGGYAQALYRLGDKAEAIKYIKRAVELSEYKDPDLLEDFRIMSLAL